MSELIPIKNKTPAEMFSPGGLDELLAAIRKEATADVWDATTKEGRAGITSSAYQVARAKGYLEKVGKEFVADIKKKAKVIDAERKKARDNLAALQEEIRAPLTEWENSEMARLRALRERQEVIKTAIPEIPTLKNVREALDLIEPLVIDDTWEELRDETVILRDATELRLMKMFAELFAADKAEQKRIEAEKAAQEAEQIEREKRIAALAAAQAIKEEQRKAAEAEDAAAQAARQAAIDAARHHDEAIAEERRKAKAYANEAAKQAQIQQAAAIAEARKADAEERAQRAMDREIEIQRARDERAEEVRSDIIASLKMLGIDSLAPHLATAIIGGHIPHVIVDYTR